MRILFLPSKITYTPFSAWMYFPDTVDMHPRIVFPLLIFGLALFVALAFRMRYTKSLLAVYSVFVLTDAARSLAI